MEKLSIGSLIIARRWRVLLTASMGLYLVLTADRGLAQDDQGIKPGVPNGTYASHSTGYIPLGPSGSLVPLAAAGHITYSNDGTTSGVFTTSVNGQISTFPVHGTWTLNPDGSVSETDTQTGGQGLTLHFTDYPTLDGNTITFVQTDTGSIASGIGTRGSPAGNEQ